MPERPGRLERTVSAEIDQLAGRYGLSERSRDQILELVALVASDPHAPTAVREPSEIVERHIADSLVALEVELLAAPPRVLDLGSGAGFPGLPLAIARPDSKFVLLESNRRKGEFIERVAAACGLSNVVVVKSRAESWAEGRGEFDVATGRAVAPLDVLLEYSAPFLRVGGALVAWRGRLEPEGELAAERAAAKLGMQIGEPRAVRPFAAAASRHLHVILKVVETPAGFPRRPGVATKRPLGRGASPERRGSSGNSDVQRSQ